MTDQVQFLTKQERKRLKRLQKGAVLHETQFTVLELLLIEELLEEATKRPHQTVWRKGFDPNGSTFVPEGLVNAFKVKLANILTLVRADYTLAIAAADLTVDVAIATAAEQKQLNDAALSEEEMRDMYSGGYC
jgi:hypothetical protein